MATVAPDSPRLVRTTNAPYSRFEEYAPAHRQNTLTARISRVLSRFTTNITSLGGLLKGLQGAGGLFICASKYNFSEMTRPVFEQMNSLSGYCDNFKDVAAPLNILAFKDLPECLCQLRTDIHSNEALSRSLTTIGKIAKIALATMGSYIWLAEKGVLSPRAISVCKRINLPLGLTAAGLAALGGFYKLASGEKITRLGILDRICTVAFGIFDFTTGVSSRALAAIPELGSALVTAGKNLQAFAQELSKAWKASEITSRS